MRYTAKITISKKEILIEDNQDKAIDKAWEIAEELRYMVHGSVDNVKVEEDWGGEKDQDARDHEMDGRIMQEREERQR